MARQSRPLKTAFWSDDKVCKLSRDARLTLAGLITCMADDEGRFIATPVAISGSLFPHDNLNPTSIKRWLAEIEAEGMVTIYRVHGGTYGHLTTWSKHQKPPHPSASNLPEPPQEDS
jgi:hypothetical protein